MQYPDQRLWLILVRWSWQNKRIFILKKSSDVLCKAALQRIFYFTGLRCQKHLIFASFVNLHNDTVNSRKLMENFSFATVQSRWCLNCVFGCFMHHYVLCSSESVLREEKGSISFLLHKFLCKLTKSKLKICFWHLNPIKWKIRHRLVTITILRQIPDLMTLFYDVGVKMYFAPNRCLRIASLLRNSRNSTNIRNPLIYGVNRYFLMFGGSQVQTPYHASMNGILTFWPWHHYNSFSKIGQLIFRNRASRNWLFDSVCYN